MATKPKGNGMTVAIERAAHGISDDQVAHLHEIQEIVGRLETARAGHAATMKTVKDVERQISEFEALAAQVERHISELEAVLKSVALGCVLENEESRKTWEETEQALTAARRAQAQHRLARPEFLSLAQASRPNVSDSASEVTDLGMELATARWEAKKLRAEHDFWK